MALELQYCLCGRTNNNAVFMIQCDFCRVWFHGRCVGVREYQAVDIDRFHCPRCEPIHGPSVLKPRLNWHRHDYSEVDAASRPVQTGTQVFIKELKTRHFTGCEEVVNRLRGQQLTLPYFIQNGFSKPIVVEERSGLDLIVPHNTFTILDVENYVGSDQEVDVIDVQRQTNVKMQLHEFVEYFLSPVRTTVLNLISLEFSHTSLSQLVEPPYIVRKLCWVTTSWPSDPPPPPPLSRPNVSKYCLLSVENSYTDFHIDFGGTSVWYHILWGEKIFYLIKPTPSNLALYQRWMKANNRSEMFFGDQVDSCYKCVVRAGETLFVPTGWIHSVLTPSDTLVFGGNFLHSHCIELQLQIYEMEKQISTPEKFRFPNYETVCWYAASSLTTELKNMAVAGTRVPSTMISGMRALMAALRHWAGETGKGGLEPPAPELHPLKLLKELQKEIRTAERQVVALNPPKPERESKRRKKKVIVADFVDYTDLTSFHSAIEERVPEKKVKDEDSQNNTFVSSRFELINSSEVDERKRQSFKLTVPKPVTYPYGLGIGMSGTPPHDPSYPPFKNEYPPNVKSEFDWPETAAESHGIRLKAALEEVSLSGTPPAYVTPPTPGSQRLKIGIPFRDGMDSKSPTNSIYDFNDENDEREPPGLMIDESPRRKGSSRNHLSNSQHSLKIRLNLAGGDTIIYGEAIDMNDSVEVLPAHPQHLLTNTNNAHNGIDELLRASAYAPDFADGSPARMDDFETGRASPSTREAIAGMLSMSRVIPNNRISGRKLLPTSLAGLAATRYPRIKRRYIEDEHISKVHQDEDYVYPSLDISDDEDFQVFKPRGKKKEDEAWNPKARIRVSGPRPERPMRQGVRRQAVEKGLEQAAARRQNLPMAKRAYHRKQQRIIEPQPCTSSGTGIKFSKVSTRPKKGMATAKQRLGKILKIHKMIH